MSSRKIKETGKMHLLGQPGCLLTENFYRHHAAAASSRENDGGFASAGFGVWACDLNFFLEWI